MFAAERHVFALILYSILAGIKHVWISGKKDNLSFKWRDGKTVGECYENWSRDGSLHIRQPDNAQGNEYCMAMLNNHFDNDGIVWHDVPCHEKKSFVCQPIEDMKEK